jgi:hypothetical protein
MGPESDLEDQMPVYKKNADHTFFEDIYLDYSASEKLWKFRYMKSRGTNLCSAYSHSDPPLIPEQLTGVWKVSNGGGHFINAPDLKIEPVLPVAGAEDLSLFWEIVDVMLQYEPLRRGLITNTKQLIEHLAKSKYLWDKKHVDLLLSRTDLIELCNKLQNKFTAVKASEPRRTSISSKYSWQGFPWHWNVRSLQPRETNHGSQRYFWFLWLSLISICAFCIVQIVLSVVSHPPSQQG